MRRDGETPSVPDHSWDHLLIDRGARLDERFRTQTVAVIRAQRDRWSPR